MTRQSLERGPSYCPTLTRAVPATLGPTLGATTRWELGPNDAAVDPQVAALGYSRAG
jgi:hypothetical protein